MIYQSGEEGLTWFTVFVEVEEITIVLWLRSCGLSDDPVEACWSYYFEEIDEMWRVGFDSLDKAINVAVAEIDKL